MAVLSQTLTDNSQNASADSQGDYEASLNVGSNSANPETRAVLRWQNITIDRFRKIDAAVLSLYAQNIPTTGTAPNVRVRLSAGTNPTMPTTATALRGVTKTVASTVRTIGINSAQGYLDFDFKDALQEIVNKSGWASGNAILITLDADPESGRIVGFRNVGWAANPPTISITHNALPAVTGISRRTMTARRSAKGQFAVNVQATSRRTMTVRRVAEGFAGPPPARIGKSRRTMEAVIVRAYGGQGDPNRSTLFPVERPYFDTHHFITEDGTSYGVVSAYDTTLGGIREGMMGSGTVWLPESALLDRTPTALQFAAALVDRDTPRFDGDVLERELPNIREIHHPDGSILPVWDIQKRARPADNRLELTARPKGPVLLDPLLSGTLQAAFATESSTPEVPVFAIDAAGGITAPLTPKRADQGVLACGVRLAERGMLPLASVGRAVENGGDSDPTSITLSYQDRHLWLSLRGVLTRLREAELGTFGAVLVLALVWGRTQAYLVSVSSLGTLTRSVPIGPAAELGERRLTAGTTAGGVGLNGFLAPGSSSLQLPFFSLRKPPRQEVTASAESFYRELTREGRSWAIVPPDYALELSRVDTKLLGPAPGETITVDFAVRRVGGYTGEISFTASAGGDLTASYVKTGSAAGVDTYRVTITAPSGTAEGTFALRVDVKAAGADNPGSLLKDVRAGFDDLVEVAASPVIMPNPSFLLTIEDTVLHRPSEFLRDTSAYANTFSWNGYARGNRAGTGVLATGQGEAAVYSAALANTEQPQRMSGQHSFSMILRQVDKIPTSNGVFFQLAADVTSGSIADGVWGLRVNGGFTLRTIFGSSVVTSPDVLGWTSGDAELGVVVTPTVVMLINRANMRSIWLPRPAWADAGARVCWGAVRTPSGTFTNVTRVHLLTASGHPYAFSDIQFRRNMDKLRDYAAPSDGKPEYPDNAVGIFRWDEATGKYQNRAAIATGVAMTATGSVGTPAGAVSTPGGTTAYVYSGREFAASGVLTVITSVGNFADAEDYNCNFGVSAAGTNIMAVEVGRRYDGKPRLRHQSGGDAGANAEWAQRDLDKTPASAVMNFALEISNSGATSKLTSLDTGQTITASGTAANGSLGVSIGAIIRASGSPVEGQKALNREMIICRGSVPAQALQDTNVLMAT